MNNSIGTTSKPYSAFFFKFFFVAFSFYDGTSTHETSAVGMKELVKCPESEIWAPFGRDFQNLIIPVGVFLLTRVEKSKLTFSSK